MNKGRSFDITNNSIITALVLLGDLVLLNVLYIAFRYLLRGVLLEDEDAHMLVVLSLSYALCAIQNGVVLYRRRVRYVYIATRALRGTVMFTLLSGVALFLGRFYIPKIEHVILYWVSLTLCIIGFRLLARKVVKSYRKHSKRMKHVIFVGSYDNIVALYNEMNDASLMDYKVEGYFDFAPNDLFPKECKYLGHPNKVADYLQKHDDVSEVYCCLSSSYEDDILPIMYYCMHHVKRFYILPNVSNYLHHRVSLCFFGRIPYFSLYQEPLMRPINRWLKRLFDILFSLFILCTIFPIMLIVVAIITKLTMPGPLFFVQRRGGRGGTEFNIYKFRSMKVNTQSDEIQATKDDPRLTKWGKIMRKYNIDEFPQFINVFLGQMSVVGPRPHMTKHNNDYSQLIDDYMIRYYVKPGITGWSQVSGYRGETHELEQMEGRVKGDIWYIEHWHMSLDIYIIYKTIANVLCGDKQAY